MAKNKEQVHLVANDGSDWTSKPSPVDPDEKRKADEQFAKAAAGGQGPSATNESR